MKKNFCLILFLFIFVFEFHAQKNATIPVTDSIYHVLDYAVLRGLCNSLSYVRPYTESQVMTAIDEILSNSDQLSNDEIVYLVDYKEAHTREDGLTKKKGSVRLSDPNLKVPLSFQFDYGMETLVSGGLYTRTRFNQVGFEFINTLNFSGDLGNNTSYQITALFDLTKMPLYEAGDDYFVGYWWYDDGVSDYLHGDYTDSDEEYPEPERRTVVKKINTSYLPYHYKKRWAGRMYFLESMSAENLECWPQKLGLSGTLTGELTTSFFNDKLIFSLGRQNREWGAMEPGASLVYNASTEPFAAFDVRLKPFNFLTLSSLTGVLEYWNQDHINDNAWNLGEDEAYYFQNGYSINMLELDFKYLHFDFGGSVIWPKRFELGYMIPFMVFVEYQNHIGDYDNLALFGDIKVQKPGLGSIWASLYLDEINGLNNNPLTSTRAMFAGQLGAKVPLSFLPFATFSMRYTKVEPYCYTHQAMNYTPWYNHYISTNYTNNGACLGYYLDPNSDELSLTLETRPKNSIHTIFQYQFIRHGADYGSQQVPGSSLYSELSPRNRDDLKKYFLHDGAYNWLHIISVGGSLDTHYKSIPIQLCANVGFLYSYYTLIDSDIYAKRSEYGNNGNSGADGNTKFHFVDNDEYPVQCGVVIGLGVKLFKW